jgi:hypothetical protein
LLGEKHGPPSKKSEFNTGFPDVRSPSSYTPGKSGFMVPSMRPSYNTPVSPLEPSMRPRYTPGTPSDNTKTPEDRQGAHARIPEDLLIRQSTGAKNTDEVDGSGYGASPARRQLFHSTDCQENPFSAGCKAPASDLDVVASREFWHKKLQLNEEEEEAKENCPHKAYLKKHVCSYCVSDSQVKDFAWSLIEKNYREIHDVFIGHRSYKVKGKKGNEWQCVPKESQTSYRCSFVNVSASKENFKCEKRKGKYTPVHFTSRGHYNSS